MISQDLQQLMDAAAQQRAPAKVGLRDFCAALFKEELGPEAELVGKSPNCHQKGEQPTLGVELSRCVFSTPNFQTRRHSEISIIFFPLFDHCFLWKSPTRFVPQVCHSCCTGTASPPRTCARPCRRCLEKNAPSFWKNMIQKSF